MAVRSFHFSVILDLIGFTAFMCGKLHCLATLDGNPSSVHHPPHNPMSECSWFIIHNSYILKNPVQALHKGFMCWVFLQVVSPIFLIREMAHEAMCKSALQ
jgi:hypothetical protein